MIIIESFFQNLWLHSSLDSACIMHYHVTNWDAATFQSLVCCHLHPPSGLKKHQNATRLRFESSWPKVTPQKSRLTGAKPPHHQPPTHSICNRPLPTCQHPDFEAPLAPSTIQVRGSGVLQCTGRRTEAAPLELKSWCFMLLWGILSYISSLKKRLSHELLQFYPTHLSLYGFTSCA